MAEELGKIEKPAAEKFEKGRKLYFVPLIYHGIESPEEYVEKFNRYWEQVEKQIDELESKLGRVNRIYHELIPAGGEDGSKAIEELNDKSHKIIQACIGKGAQLEAVEEGGKQIIRVTATDYVIGAKLAIDADFLTLAAAVVAPEGNKDLSQLYRVSLGPDDFFKEAHVKLKPVEFGTDGAFLCGTAHYPKHIQEVINQAYGAAGRVLTLLSRDTVTASGSVAEVCESDCVSCGACITACTYDAIDFYDTAVGKKAKVNPVLCKGDGLCNTKCPTGAISLKHFTDEELISQIDAAFEEAIVEQLDKAVGD